MPTVDRHKSVQHSAHFVVHYTSVGSSLAVVFF